MRTAKWIKDRWEMALGLSFVIFHLAFGLACTSEVDDYFDQSATQRLSATIDRARQILRAAPYGWEFEYYPGRNL